MAKKRPNLRAKKTTKAKSTIKKEPKKKSESTDDVIYNPPYIVPPNTVTIIPPSPSVLEKKLKKHYSIPFQTNWNDIKEILKKKVDDEGMDEDHAYFLLRCKKDKKQLQVYYDIIMGTKDDWEKVADFVPNL